MVELSIQLFGKPSWDIENFEGQKLEEGFSDVLVRHGDKLKAWLYEISEVHKKLLDNGWSATGSLYYISYHKDITIEEAKEELKKLGLGKFIGDLVEKK